jgi:hypothetical protein
MAGRAVPDSEGSKSRLKAGSILQIEPKHLQILQAVRLINGDDKK